MSNIASCRQLRAARTLAGLTQAELSTEAGFNPRAAKYWESRDDKLPTDTPESLDAIERVLRGVMALKFLPNRRWAAG
jgi:transcriptional regulator with XRE-family HTH domain